MQHVEKRRMSDLNPVHSKCVRSECTVPPAAIPELSEETSEEDSNGSENQLDLDLRKTSRRHNLTKRNVRNILHEVITHERVVDMMKAAIRDTQGLPLFEPKMTRSRLKQAVEQGQKVNWSLSAVSSSNRSSGFVDMELEEEEDSSDEEYCPDEDEEDDTTDELFLSDGDSLASPPRMHLCSQTRATLISDQPQSKPAESHSAQASPSCTPTDSFLERLNAVEEELNSSPTYFYEVEESLACRTRSKLPLVDVPINRLEAELLAPDITADMYSSPTHQTRDPHWTLWLQGLVDPDNTEEAEDEDDPEYNFVEDLDEPDQEDYRTDRAVQITKKEVNELLEELFETLQERAVEEEEHAEPDEEESFNAGPQFNVPQALRLEAPLVPILTDRRRTVSRQNQTRRALQDTTNTSQTQAVNQVPNQLKTQERDQELNQDHETRGLQTHSHVAQLVLVPGSGPALKLSNSQKLHLQQQIQQHVQLLAQVHLLTKGVQALSHEADLTKHFLVELDQFSRNPSGFSRSNFKVCNLHPALDLIEEQLLDTDSASHGSVLGSASTTAGSKRWLPSMTPATNGHAFPLLPAPLAWLFATRPVFLYPELLPVCSLDPTHHAPQKRKSYTQGEDGLIVLGLKHFEGSVDHEQLITDFLLCKKRWNVMKHVREMSSTRAPPNIIKSFLESGVVPPLPLACLRVDPSDQRPPVDRDCSQCPNWLKNSREIIQRTRLSCSPTSYPPSLPIGCTLRLHPHWLAKACPPPKRPQRRLFTLAHNATLMPLAKKHDSPEQEFLKTHVQEPNGQSNGEDDNKTTACLTHSKGKAPTSGEIPKDNQSDDTALFLRHNPVVLVNSETNLHKHNLIPLLLPLGSNNSPLTVPLGQPQISTLPAIIHAAGLTAEKQALIITNTTPRHPLTNAISGMHSVIPTSAPIKPCTGSVVAPTIPVVNCTSSKMPATRTTGPIIETATRIMSDTIVLSAVHNTISPPMMATGQHTQPTMRTTNPIPNSNTPLKHSPNLCPGIVMFQMVSDAKFKPNVAQQSGQGHSKVRDEGVGRIDKDKTEEKAMKNFLSSKERDGNDMQEGGGANGEEGGGANEQQRASEGGGANEQQRTSEGGGANGGGDNAGGGASEGGDYGGEGGSGAEGKEGAGPGEGGGDEGGDEEEEEEEFDDLTQDEDEEEVMSSASEESVLSVPELQETMKQLTWLAAERRLGDADSEEDLSQEEEEEDEEDGNTKGEDSREERGNEARGDEETTAGEEAMRGVSRGPTRGRGRSRPPRGLKRSRQDRLSKDASKLLLLYDENILENDPHRESKDTAFAQSYLSRVREALQDAPSKMEKFVSYLGEFEKVGERHEVLSLFRKLQCILGHRTDLLRDFAAFLRPEQALECGLFEEQQAFDRSRRFLRQLEISFGDNPSHYQKIIKALQTGPDLSPTSVHELKSQMTSLLKGHTHLQSEFWVFFDDLRPPPARPGQFEDAHWPEEGEGREGAGLGSGGGNASGFEEVTLPELDEEEDRHKSRPMTVRRQRRKMDSDRNYKECDWSEKSWACLCHEAKIRKHRKKGCPRCHASKGLGVVSRAMKSLDPLYSQMGADKDRSPQPERSVASWEGPYPLNEEEDQDEDKDETKTEPAEKRRREQSTPLLDDVTDDVTDSTSSAAPPSSNSTEPSSSVTPPHSDMSETVAPSFPQELTVCAKNISLTASGEKVILWTRDADRVILTRCQQEGANPNTFHQISAVLGNKTPSQVSQRFQDLMRLFRTAARHTSSEDEALPTEPAPNQEEN